MKTLADLKRDIEVGDNILCISFKEASYKDPAFELVDVPISEKLNKMRVVIKKNTTGFYLKSIHDETTSKGSFCNWPKKAAQLRYDGDTFTIIEIDHYGKVWQERTYKIFK